MPEVYPGASKYRHSDTIPHELGSSAASRGDVMAIGASGTLVQTTGSNGVLGVLQSATTNDEGDLGPGDHEDLAESGDAVAVVMPGNVVRASVETGTAAGDELDAGASGQFVAAASARGDAVAIEAVDGDGFALVYLR